jgi:hypothetical protein
MSIEIKNPKEEIQKILEKGKKKFKSGNIEIVFKSNHNNSFGDEFELIYCKVPLCTISGDGIRDLLTCLIDLTDYFKALSDEAAKK